MEINQESLIELIYQSRLAHADLSYSLGIYFGYPHCCRVQFCEDVLNGRRPDDRVINGSGFIPCSKHYNEIIAGTTTLTQLIENRICTTLFDEN